RSGVAHFEGENDAHTLGMVRELLPFLPSNNLEDPPFVPTDDDPNRRDPGLGTIIPDSPNKPYDMHDLIRAVIDDGYFFEVQPAFARNILCGFARLGGRSVGIVANQPAFLAPDGAVNIIFRDQIARAKEPERERERLVNDYRHTFANPFKAAELGYVDEIISPQDTRPRLIGALEMLQNKRDRNPPKK